MVRSLRSIIRFIPTLLLGLVLGSPLRAQLDPRLQGTTTDFLDLFQQSSQAKVKPEILTIFDFSGSMQALMFHPQFVNSDTDDTGDTNVINFTWHPAVTSVPGQNTYTITAKAHGCTAVYTTYVVTVNSNGSVGINTGTSCAPTSTYTITATAAGNSSTKATGTITVGGNFTSGTNTTSSNYQIVTATGSTTNPIRVSPAGPYASGQLLTLTANLATTRSNHAINWTSTGGIGGTVTTGASNPYLSTWTWTVPIVTPFQISNISTATTTFTAGTAVTFNASLLQHNGSDTVINWSDGKGNTGVGTSWSWTVPAYDPGVSAQPAYVSAAFGADGNNSTAFSGATCTQLIKPDGSVVTETDAGNAANPTGMTFNGIFSTAAANKADVRNWVRAASHARFVYTDTTNGNTVRTVDIPLPWKIMDRNSTGNPLSSKTVLDSVVKTSANGTTTTYGSQQNVEFDLMYSLDNGSNVLDGDNTTQTSSSLSLPTIKTAYLTWLFTQRYQGSSSTSAYWRINS